MSTLCCVNIFLSLIVLFHGDIVDLEGKPRSIFFHYTIFVQIFVDPLVCRALHMFIVVSIFLNYEDPVG